MFKNTILLRVLAVLCIILLASADILTVSDPNIAVVTFPANKTTMISTYFTNSAASVYTHAPETFLTLVTTFKSKPE